MQPYQLRLPSYRSSYLNRYHPYPRSAPSLHETVSKENSPVFAQLEDDLLQVLESHLFPALDVVVPRRERVLLDIEPADVTFVNLERVVCPYSSAAGTTRGRLRSIHGSEFSLLVVDLAILVLLRRKPCLDA